VKFLALPATISLMVLAQALPRSLPQEGVEAPPQETPQETPQDAPQELPQELPQEVPQEAPAPTTVIPRDGCVTSECHVATKSHSYLHGPLHVNACDSCHELIDVEEHEYEMLREPEQLCLHCHEFTDHEAGTLHAPLEGGECLPCHDPHGGEGPRLLRDISYAEMCTSCHQDTTGGRPLVHSPASVGACGACHEPHVAENPNLLTIDGKALCLRCHVTIGLEMDVMNVVHPPAEDDCRICHDPHATEYEALLITDPVTLCTSCHQGIQHAIASSPSKHAAVTTERACLNCHNPHASDHARLLREDTTSLCFECHDEELERDEGGTVANIRELIEESLVLHGPTEQRNCSACHSIHGGGRERLLSREYSRDLYVPFDDSTYSLCFSCHDQAAVMLEETETVTSFRNGTQNLHFLHVNRASKGRTCHICHDPHASNNENHLRDSVPFGPSNWELPIAWERTPNGGTCGAGCHVRYAYDRVNPVTYAEVATGEQDWSGGKYVPPKRSGAPVLKDNLPEGLKPSDPEEHPDGGRAEGEADGSDTRSTRD